LRKAEGGSEQVLGSNCFDPAGGLVWESDLPVGNSCGRNLPVSPRLARSTMNAFSENPPSAADCWTETGLSTSKQPEQRLPPMRFSAWSADPCDGHGCGWGRGPIAALDQLPLLNQLPLLKGRVDSELPCRSWPAPPVGTAPGSRTAPTPSIAYNERYPGRGGSPCSPRL
jgi:hypothetical protein